MKFTNKLFSVAGFVLLAVSASAAATRPNFVLIYTDDQRYDAMSVVQKEQGNHGRFPWEETPNMDRLAREGARFRNAFVVNSLCSPSRASMLTGTYGYRNGVVNNHTEFPTNNVTYAALLRQAGYRTGYVGKWHHGQQLARPGFDYVASFIGQGHYTDCPFEINGVLTPTYGWVDDVTTEFALKFLRESKDRPFVLAVGFKSPHGPCTPPPRLADFYGQQESRTVPNLSVPAIFLNDPTYAGAKPALPGWKKENLNYHRVIHGADEDLGKILDELDRLGLAGDTMVIFTSDNGLFHGEHRLGDKRAAYEEAMRVPMLVRYPKLVAPGQVLDAMVLNIDIPETMLDYAGVAIPSEMQGRSWRPLFQGGTNSWRRTFFYDYFQENQYPRVPTVTAVRSDLAQLALYPGHPEWSELFDLQADPFEVKNLYNDPSAAALRRQMESQYEQEARAVAFQIPPFADHPGNNRKKPGGGKNKEFQPPFAPAKNTAGAGD